jgi:hypothetical protein
MIGRLLIDECLSPALVQLAIDAGHVESTSVRDRGRLGLKDWELMEYVVQEDFILVTRNAQDFRGDGKANPGGLHASAEVHAGLICLDSALEMDLDLQQGSRAKTLDYFQHIEHVARMLPIHRGNQFAPYSSAASRTGRVISVVKVSCAVETSGRSIAHGQNCGLDTFQVGCNGLQCSLPIERVVSKYHVDVDGEPWHVLHKEVQCGPSL